MIRFYEAAKKCRCFQFFAYR